MSFTALIGLQWGDEGKGKVVDYLSADYDIVVRFQGGANAGHTVNVRGKEFVFHILPTGLLRPTVNGAIGPGVSVDPEVLVEEMAQVKKASGTLKGRFMVDERAHLVLPYHKLQDRWQEEPGNRLKIGSTQRGIGPSYRDRHGRTGVRVGMLLDDELLRWALERALAFNNPLLDGLYGKPPLSVDEVMDFLAPLAKKIKPFIGDVSEFLLENSDKNCLLEGAQGTLLDVDFGTYPFVTSSNCVAGEAAVGLGIPPYLISKVIGVTKAYTTRVGEGPFPTEEEGDLGEELRKRGTEYGAATGRPRRCGWLDLVALKYAVRINGVNELVMTKMDVLSGMDEIKVCVAYEAPGGRTKRFPAHGLDGVKPVYKTMAGWGALTGERIPHEALEFIKFVEEETGVPITLLSYGQDRAKVIKRRPPAVSEAGEDGGIPWP